MNDKHEHVDEEGVKWERVFSIPYANVPLVFDPNSSQDFVNKTKGTKGTLGDLWDRSKELSDKRKKQQGEDKVEKDFFKNYSGKRRGMKHKSDPSQKGKGSIEI